MWQKFKNYFHYLKAALSALFFNFPSKNIFVIAITGTDGKTTTTHMVYEILKSSGKKVSMISSVYAAIGAKTSETGLHVTTPSSWQIQRLLRRAVDAGHEYFVLEATSHGLDQNRLAFVDVNLAVLTNITSDHLDYHKTWKNYARAKAKLFQIAKQGVINMDDTASFQFLKDHIKKNLVSYSINQNSDYSYKDFNFKLNIPGNYNISNALAAATTTSLIGITKTKINKSLNQFKRVKGRMDKIDLKQNFELFIDFAHTPNSFEQALSTLKKQMDGRGSSKLIAVFGAAGQRDKQKRPIMGKIADAWADVIVITSEDPRKENAQKISAQIKVGIKNKKLDKDLFIILNRQQAIEFAINLANQNDVVVLLGKGHEKSMAFGKKETPWDEYEVARGTIKKKLHAKRK